MDRENGSPARRGIRLDRTLFPLAVIALFLAVIAASMVLGLWRTKGGQHRGRGGGHGASAPATAVAYLKFDMPSAII